MHCISRACFCGILLAAIVAAALVCNGAANEARLQAPAATGAAAQPASSDLRTVPQAGPLGQPKSVQQLGLPAGATEAATPLANPQTPEKIALGQKLFFDARLSVDGTVACSTCHDPARAFTDGLPLSIGVQGRVGQRNSPTILNALYNKTQFWDGRAKTLEEQAGFPIINSVEMGQPDLAAAVASIAAIKEYQQEFQAVFGRPPNETDLVRAIASYERTQVSFNSPFDHFIAGEQQRHRRRRQEGLGALQYAWPLQ